MSPAFLHYNPLVHAAAPNLTLLQRLPARLVILFSLLAVFLLIYPVRTQFYRTSILLTFAALTTVGVLALWKRPRWRVVPLVPVVLVAIFLLLPGRDANPAALRRTYCWALQRYEGTRYVWGGEGFCGVDCSGLLRAALVDAHVMESVRTFNPALARRAIWLWWTDSSAADLARGERNGTVALSAAAVLDDLDDSRLQPGDFAITADGIHALAYLGGQTWIEADPFELRVLQLTPTTSSPWHVIKAIPCRWECLTVR